MISSDQAREREREPSSSSLCQARAGQAKLGKLFYCLFRLLFTFLLFVVKLFSWIVGRVAPLVNIISSVYEGIHFKAHCWLLV